jgi:hypothetical protein
MFFQKYLPNLQKYKEQFQDRLSRDSDNETIKSFITLIDNLRSKFPFIGSADASIDPEFTSTEIAKLSANELRDQFSGEELDYYLLHREQIDALKVYIESYQKVSDAANNFFDKK